MKAFFVRKNKSVFLSRAAAAVAAAALLITSARGDADAQDGGGGGGGSFWDKFPNVITSCDFGGGGELEFSGTFTFLKPIHCTTPTVSFLFLFLKA